MSDRKITYASPAQAEADRLLAEFRQVKKKVIEAETALAAELKRLQRLSPFWGVLEARLRNAKERLRLADEDLKAQEKKHQAEFFPGEGLGSYSLALPAGTLIYDKSDYVVKPRKVNVLANLLKYGFDEALRFSVVVDWDALNDKEEWPDAALALIGTRREVKETYAYEVKEA